MDESPSEAMNPMNEEKMSKKSSWEALPTQMKVESLDLHANDMNLKKIVKNGVEFHFDVCPPPSERDMRIHCDPLRRRAQRVEIEMMRTIQKLEKVCKHRGLPIDKETLSSDAKKDAFDLRVLNESLPSTSEKKLCNSVYSRILHLGSNRSLWSQNVERFEGIRCTLSAPLSEFKRSPAGFNLLKKDKDVRSIHNVLCPSLRQRARRRKAWEDQQAALDEQKATSPARDDSVAENAVQNLEGQVLRLNLNVQTMDSFTTPSSTIVSAPLGDKPEEKSSVVENVGFPPLLPPSWDSERNWITDFQSPQMNVPLNSPTKCDPKFEGTGCNQAMANLLADNQAHRFKELRVENRFRLRNAQRGVLSGDMKGSECEDTSSKPATKPLRFSRIHLRDLHNSSNSAAVQLGLLNCTRFEMFQKLMRRRQIAHSESMGSIGSHFLLGNSNSDKVLPD